MSTARFHFRYSTIHILDEIVSMENYMLLLKVSHQHHIFHGNNVVQSGRCYTWVFESRDQDRFPAWPIITFDTKLQMAEAGWSGSSSANRWHELSMAPCFLATNPNTLQNKSPMGNQGKHLSIIVRHERLLLTPIYENGRSAQIFAQPVNCGRT